MNPINERVKEVYAYSKCESIRRFAEKIGVNCGTVTFTIQKGTEPSASLLQSILRATPKVSAEWLMRGEGAMLRDDVGGRGSVSEGARTERAGSSLNQNHSEGPIFGDGNVVNSINGGELVAALKEQLRIKDEQINKILQILE